MQTLNETAKRLTAFETLLDLRDSVGRNASGAGIDNDKSPTDFKAGMYKAYAHCLEMIDKRINERI